MPDQALLRRVSAARANFLKQAYTPPMPAGGGMPPMDPAMMAGAMPPGAMPPGAMPPMDPAMMGGAMPPMDPAMLAGAMPPMDPAMMGGAMPPMDPAMMGGAMPPMDPAMMGAMPPEAPPMGEGQPVVLSLDDLRAILKEVGAEADKGVEGAEEIEGEPGEKRVTNRIILEKLEGEMNLMKDMLTAIMQQLGMGIPQMSAPPEAPTGIEEPAVPSSFEAAPVPPGMEGFSPEALKAASEKRAAQEQSKDDQVRLYLRRLHANLV